MGYKSFWAEDGSLFYQDAADESFVETLKSPAAGYLTLIGRIGGKIVSYLPLSNVTYVNFLLATFVMALSIVTVFNHSRTLVANLPLRIIASISLVFTPVANFDSLGNLANLHFTLPFVVLIILISSQKNKKTSLLSVFLIILGCLSDPLCIFCFPALLYLKKSGTRFTFSIKNTIYAKTYLASMFIQLAFTMAYLSQGARSFGQEHSVVKTLYLFLDRVVGSTFIPGWGRVSGSDFAGESFTTKLLSRAAAAATVLLIWLVLYLKLVKKEKVVLDERDLIKKSTLLWQLLACSLTYWFVAGIAFNPEPRYGILPSLCLLMSAIVIIDRYLETQKKLIARRFTLLGFFALISATWILSWAPSSHRITGPEWRDEIAKAIETCANLNTKSAKLQILPEKGNWYVEVPCTSLSKDYKPTRF
jgi:hypothetical protein